MITTFGVIHKPQRWQLKEDGGWPNDHYITITLVLFSKSNYGGGGGSKFPKIWLERGLRMIPYKFFQVLHLLPDSEVTQKHEVPQHLLNEMQKIHQLVRIYCPFTYNHFKNVSYKTYISSINCFWKFFVMKSRRPFRPSLL